MVVVDTLLVLDNLFHRAIVIANVTVSPALSDEVLRERIAAALAYRGRVAPGETYRMVHAEGDGLPALIVKGAPMAMLAYGDLDKAIADAVKEKK